MSDHTFILRGGVVWIDDQPFLQAGVHITPDQFRKALADGMLRNHGEEPFAIIDEAVCDDLSLLDRVRVRAAADHMFSQFETMEAREHDDYYRAEPYYDPAHDFSYAAIHQHALSFEEMRQLTKYDQEYPAKPRESLGTLIRRTVTVVYDDRGYAATYGVTVDGELELWAD